MNSSFLIEVDTHSKWPEVAIISSTTSAKTIEALRAMFSTHGLPNQIVSDNGTQFVSTEFKTFLQKNGIQHLTSAPYHPGTNGLAERFARTVKASLKNDRSTASLQYKLHAFLLKYRNCLHAATGNSPAVMLMAPITILLRPTQTGHSKKSYERGKITSRTRKTPASAHRW